MLQLPTAKRGKPTLGGPAANAYFAKLDRHVGKPAHGAHFAAYGDQVVVVPAVTGRRARRAALGRRGARRRRVDRQPRRAASRSRRSTSGARPRRRRRWGSPASVGSYETIYGGDRRTASTTSQLVAHLVDDKLIAPGATFSFNQATGERTAAKGFLEAPVIINGELSTGLGGGVCQVSTTVFNAAYEAGLPITARTNHALYISHYPLGRDATVDYPDIDLKFVNDTGHWLLLRTFVGSSSLVVDPLRHAAAPPRRDRDRAAARRRAAAGAADARPVARAGHAASSQDYGEPAQSTSVHRLVYAPDGKLLSDSTWYSNYRSSPKIVLVGPKPKPSRSPRRSRRRRRRLRRPTPAPTARRATRAAIASTQPLRRPRRPERRGVDRPVRRPALGDHRRRRARSRTRSGTARRARRGSARGRAAGRRSAPARGTARATRARATRSPRRAAAGSRRRTARGTRRGRPRTRRSSSSCARRPARRSRRSARGSRAA